MTETEQRMYNLIAEAGEWCGTAALGWAMWPEGRIHRSAQGMALAAGKVAYRLTKAKLIRQYSKPGTTLTHYRVVSNRELSCRPTEKETKI